MDQSALGQSDDRIIKLSISPEYRMKKPDFSHVDTD